MAWFTRTKKGILTPTSHKRAMPDGLWHKTPKGTIVHIQDLKDNAYVCPEDDYHMRIGSKEYFELLFDQKRFNELAPNLASVDRLDFVDTKPYKERLSTAQEETKLQDAMRVAHGKMNDIEIVIACMDFTFIGGSMGAVVGEKIATAVDYAIAHKLPLLIISKSGGARMMEAGISLMQMAKASAKLLQLAKAKLPYISLLTDPTMGGVTASFAMLGDFNIAEPEALIGFSGPRLIRDTIKRDLPKGFQTSEFLLQHGFLDFIVDRRMLKTTLTKLLNML